MRIAICGSHGVGKTTLLNAINSENKITEVARKLIKQVGNPKDMTEFEKVIFQIYLLKEQFKQEERKGNDFISDRSIYDVLAYYSLIDDEKISEDENYIFGAFDEEQNILIEKVKNHKYDLVFYIPIEFPLEDDGIRFEGDEFQKAIDDKIKKILGKNNVPYITLTGSVEERLKKFYDVVNLFENNSF